MNAIRSAGLRLVPPATFVLGTALLAPACSSDVAETDNDYLVISMTSGTDEFAVTEAPTLSLDGAPAKIDTVVVRDVEGRYGSSGRDHLSFRMSFRGPTPTTGDAPYYSLQLQFGIDKVPATFTPTLGEYERLGVIDKNTSLVLFSANGASASGVTGTVDLEKFEATAPAGSVGATYVAFAARVKDLTFPTPDGDYKINGRLDFDGPKGAGPGGPGGTVDGGAVDGDTDECSGYGDWLYVKSDKALRYRSRVIAADETKRQYTIAFQYQIDETANLACDNCGYWLYASDSRTNLVIHRHFLPAFRGKLYNLKDDSGKLVTFSFPLAPAEKFNTQYNMPTDSIGNIYPQLYACVDDDSLATTRCDSDLKKDLAKNVDSNDCP